MTLPVTTDADWYSAHRMGCALLMAPPGCGKTEDLASWLATLVRERVVEPPRQVLGLTFSNKAKANLRSRLRTHLGPRWWRYAAITNFHGLCFRLYQHHAGAIGQEPLEIAPQRGWLNALTSAVVRDTDCERDDLAAALRRAKCGPYNADEVLARIESTGLAAAAEYGTPDESVGGFAARRLAATG